MPAPVTNIISVDVEDYFHPTELESVAPRSRWDALPRRAVDSTLRLLDTLAAHQVRGTFFILGWLAEREPALIRRIADAGHEIACHSYWHRLVYSLTPEEFREDTQRAIDVIADACGVRPVAYRAPSYSITSANLWALDVLAECAITHDSSIYPIVHDRYGIPGFHRHACVVRTESGPLIEMPIATVRLNAQRVSPVGGGGYLRLLPYRYTAAGLRRINDEEQQPACVYLHPWEVDPDHPRMAQGTIARARTYFGLRGMASKFDRLLSDFSFAPLCEVLSQPPALEFPLPRA